MGNELNDVLEAARSESARIAQQFERGLPEDARHLFSHLRDLISEDTTAIVGIETRLRLIARKIEEYVSEPEAIDTLRLVEAERIKACNAMKKCAARFYTATRDFESCLDGQQQGDLFGGVSGQFLNHLKALEDKGYRVQVGVDDQIVDLTQRKEARDV